MPETANAAAPAHSDGAKRLKLDPSAHQEPVFFVRKRAEDCTPQKADGVKITDIHLPTKGSPDAAGFDLHACKAMVIPANGKGLVPTGLSIKTPVGTYGRIAPRSGLAWKKHLDVGAGVIDADYRGRRGL